MSIVGERRAATNRATRHEELILAERSPRASLRRAVEWVMSEARHLETADVIATRDQIRQIAQTLNERSRP